MASSRRSPGWLGALFDEVLDEACAVMGAEPEVRRSSADREGWLGPPAVWFA